MRRLITLMTVLWIAAPQSAFAWGGVGHRIVGETASRALPTEIPGFLRKPQAAADLGELSREPDRTKDSGTLRDSDRDPAHFVDVEDDGRILGGPTLEQLPSTRAAYEAALRAAGTDGWKAGYLPYAIVDRWQELAKNFAYWRVLRAAESNPRWRARRAWFVQDRRRREALIMATLGDLGHFVGDGAQPLHVTAHYNGWGDYPNPKGFTKARIHSSFEGDFVRDSVSPRRVAAGLSPLRALSGPAEPYVESFLIATSRQVEPLYELEKAGAFRPGDPRGAAFAEARLAAGASALRDLIVMAWRDSANQKVGWRPVSVADVVAGRVDPYPSLYGVD